MRIIEFIVGTFLIVPISCLMIFGIISLLSDWKEILNMALVVAVMGAFFLGIQLISNSLS